MAEVGTVSSPNSWPRWCSSLGPACWPCWPGAWVGTEALSRLTPRPSAFPSGVGLSFFFAVPLILLVFSTFLVGGNVQTLVCRSWESGELYEVGGGRCGQRKRAGRKWKPEKARGREGGNDEESPRKIENHHR